MNSTFAFIATFWIGLSSLAAPIGGNPASSTADGPCRTGPYCARTDRKVEPYSATPPAIGPAGSVIKDPAFGSRIVRVTDISTDPQRSGKPFFTPASAEQNSWNTKSTKFYALDSGGAYWLFEFDPATMAVRNAGKIAVPWHSIEFSYTEPNLLYGMAPRSSTFQQYDLSSAKLSSIDEASRCISLKGTDYGGGVSVSADDRRMMAVFGPQQDHNYLVYVYDRDKGCRWYNTQTGEVGGKWGPTGTISADYRFGIHDARISKSGVFVEISGSGKGPVYWQVDSTNAVLCSNKEDQCLGHHAMGFSHLLNSPNRTHPLELVIRPLNDLKAMRRLIDPMPPLIGWYDYHISWNHVDSRDNTPACFSTYRPNNPTTAGAPLVVSGPWENEIDCVQTDGKASTVWRFAHTYSSGKNGFWSQPRGNVSPDGRFFMFTSDWQGQLGTKPAGKQYRTDVFVVELR